MYLRDERLRLYQASLEVTVTINRLSIYKLSEWLSLFAVSIAVIDVQDTAYVIRNWVPYSVRNPVGIIHSRLNSNTPLSHKGNEASFINENVSSLLVPLEYDSDLQCVSSSWDSRCLCTGMKDSEL